MICNKQASLIALAFDLTTKIRYLIHAPYGGKEGRNGSWRALVEAQQAGRIRSLGVSNYGVHHLNELESYIKELESQNGKGKGGEISVGQWELHPWLTRKDIVDWCEQRGVICEAYCPIVRGQRFEEPTLRSLVKKYQKTPAQVLIRWSLQKVAPRIDHFRFLQLTRLTRASYRCRNPSRCHGLKKMPTSTTSSSQKMTWNR